MAYDHPDDMPRFRVGEFWSSASAGRRVLCLAEGGEVEQWERHKDFIRWVSPVYPPGVMAVDEPQGENGEAV